jgi:valyl-tRNA synthetase
VLEGSLRLLHPFMPFVTEEAWQYLTGKNRELRTQNSEPRTQNQELSADSSELSAVSPADTTPGSQFSVLSSSIMVAPYPTQDPAVIDEQAEKSLELLRELIVAMRNIRTEYKVEPARQIAATLVGGGHITLLEEQRAVIARLARIAPDQLVLAESLAEVPKGAAAIVVGAIEVFLPLAGLIDLAAERARLAKDLEAGEADVLRREGRLGNPGFVDKAPAAVVQRERDGLDAMRATVAKLRERIAELGA